MAISTPLKRWAPHHQTRVCTNGYQIGSLLRSAGWGFQCSSPLEAGEIPRGHDASFRTKTATRPIKKYTAYSGGSDTQERRNNNCRVSVMFTKGT